MAEKTEKLVNALRETAGRLESESTRYEWGHMGRCNCGHLVQTVTQKSDKDIAQAVKHRLNEWTEHANDYCATTGHDLEDIFLTLEDIGFKPNDFHHLEYLSDPKVLRSLPDDRRNLRRNRREDVSLYMRTMADVLEGELVP